MKGERFLELVVLVDRLRGPGGCPWDREQTFDTLKPMMLEEAYEVLDAMDSGDRQEFCAELGDLLFQVVFLSRVAEDEGWFQIDDVAHRIIGKMIRRHPHVFGAVNASTSDQVLENWETIKRSERAERQGDNGMTPPPSILEGIAPMPALLTASKLTSKAARVGFDWPHIDEIFTKLHEEVDELKDALQAAPEAAASSRIEQEVGDLLFVAVNIARFLRIDPETALRKTNQKFVSRFQHIERRLRESGRDFSQSNLEEMERFWQEAKKEV
ncbi:MAG: nucleoside triphosphate pyrophosphohydrolase [Acidobacteria bacterium]|nr:nucleoside triphosphate pyrophosphohydrolase [Acidobacteriota bacterium]MCI0717834.1 nucleoside triphosphate pyrophosphohydrolase [Acidobacteriota bacterium]